MAFCFWLGVSLLLLVCSTTKCAAIPNGVLDMECRDRYFMIAVDLSFTGDEPRFEAVDGTGVYPITGPYAAECGYTISVLPLPGHVELRASYFSCHADNKDDKVFTFNFNLIATHGEQKVTYALNKTCSPSLPWSPREVLCETNYMEVSVRSDMACPSGTKRDDWTKALTAGYTSATSDWQVMFQREGQQLTPMNISDAREKNYVFDVTDGRLVFRTPYGQPDSITTMIFKWWSQDFKSETLAAHCTEMAGELQNLKVGAAILIQPIKCQVDGVPVEVIHPILFSRQSWVVLMVDLVAVCSMHEGSYNGNSVVWETPEVLYPLASGLSALDSREVNMGVNGELVEQPIVTERGYNMEKHGAIVQISIPYNAEGGYRKSFVMDNVYHELYVFNLYFEQIFVDEEYMDTRFRLFRPLATPLLSRSVFTVNNTVLEEHMFSVYIGDFPEDVELAAVKLNGEDFSLPFTNTSSYNISKVLQPNYTTGYILKVPFEDPIVVKKLSNEGVLQHTLDINYTLTILPEREPYYHLASFVALMNNVFPPTFAAACSVSGISFVLDHQPFDYLWVVYVGPNMLTPELAAQRGYIMHNNDRRLFLDVPLFTDGYTYEDIGLETFSGTFRLQIHNSKTLEVQGSSVKTCQFTTSELIMCSTDGKMTVVADVSMAIPNWESATRTSLLDRNCGPKEADDTRVLFTFGLNSCGSRVTLAKDAVTYENEIAFNPKFLSVKNSASRNATDKVMLQCVYPLTGLIRLFSAHKFVSDNPGVGSITRPVERSQQLHPTVEPMTTPDTTLATTKRPITAPDTTMDTTMATTKRPITTPDTTMATTKRPITTPDTTMATTERPIRKLPAMKSSVRFLKVSSSFKYSPDALSKEKVIKVEELPQHF